VIEPAGFIGLRRSRHRSPDSLNDDAMKITDIETYTVSAVWKIWLFIRVRTDSDLYGVGEATINGFIKATESAVHELRSSHGKSKVVLWDSLLCESNLFVRI
jgi:L-alanine-DL-glutamate epimerase-like enolase superfamily enzyme